MEMYKYHSNITQKRHGASRNYRYVLDVSVACAFASSSKPSCFFMRACSSCCTSPHWTPSFSRSERSSAVFFSASASACLRVPTSVAAPTIGSAILLFFAIKPLYRHILLLRVFRTFLFLELPFGKAELLLGPLEVLFEDFHLRS